MERAAGIEPASSAWKAEVLPLNYARRSAHSRYPSGPDNTLPRQQKERQSHTATQQTLTPSLLTQQWQTAIAIRPPYTNLVEGADYAKPAACRPPGRRKRRTNGCAVSPTPFSTKRLALIHLNLRRSQQLLLPADHRILIWWRGADSNHRSFRVRFTV